VKRLITLTICLILSLPFFGYAQTYTVERVIDGDNIILTNREIVRLIGIDVPEVKPNEKAKRDSERTGQDVETINKMGQEAIEFIKGLGLEGKKVQLKFGAQKRDKFGRLPAYVYFDYCEGAADCLLPDYYFYPFLYSEYEFPQEIKNYVFINATIIKAGYASPLARPSDVKYDDLFEELYEEARENKRGLWKIQEGNSCLRDKECKTIDCAEAIRKNQKCNFNKPICRNKKCTCQFICA